MDALKIFKRSDAAPAGLGYRVMPRRSAPWKIFVGALAAVGLAAPDVALPESLDTVKDPVQELRETQLENGLRVLTLEDHSTPVVAFQIWVEVGSKD
ncbi:MAG: hypothetical protein HRU14_16575, partial [Planctomycetes bacterium]|nr:hypothetical protein [Planctomycetota bacterium]